MHKLKEFNICIIKPENYGYSAIFMDQARYFSYQFAKFGYSTTINYNQLKKGVTNFVFGAWLGFDPKLRNEYRCIFVNLEQLGPDGSNGLSLQYMELLKTSPAIDYDEKNICFYAKPKTVPIAPILFAPYLTDFSPIPLEDRPIDILFFGSMTERRVKIIQKIIDSGIGIEYIKKPTFGEELFKLIRSSKCVLNIHAYQSSIFEQARASLCLSLGTPVISERTPITCPHIAYEGNIFWAETDDLINFLKYQFMTSDFFKNAEDHLFNFRKYSDTENYRFLIKMALSLTPSE